METSLRFCDSELSKFKNYKNISSSIKKIVETPCDGKNIKIIAGAGAGKTEAMTFRILNLLLSGKAEPQEIVAFTFTEKAAKSLKSRIYLRIQQLKRLDIQKQLGNMYIGTIHGYCLRLLQDNFHLGDYEILEEVKLLAYIKKHHFELGLGLKKEPLKEKFNVDLTTNHNERCKKFLQSYDIFYNEEIPAEKLADKCPAFKRQIERYEKFLKKDKLLSFSRLIYLAIQKLESAPKTISNIKFLFVDEYQDINNAQEHLIKILGSNAETFIVGDPKQSIYHWRGSKIECFSNFDTLFTNKELKTFKIPENWRSLQSIVKLANKFADQSEINKPNLESTPQRIENSGLIAVLTPENEPDEVNYIVRQIKELHDSKEFNYNDFAVLFRSVKTSGEKFIDAFAKNKIPYVVGGKVGLFRRNEIQAVVRFLMWLSDNGFWHDEKNKYKRNNDTKESGDTLLEKGIDFWINACKEIDFKPSYSKEKLENKLNNWKDFILQEIDKEKDGIFEPKNHEEIGKSVEKDILALDSNGLKKIEKKFHKLEFGKYLDGMTYGCIFWRLLNVLEIENLDYNDPLHATLMANLGAFDGILNDFEFTYKRSGNSFVLTDKLEDLNYFLSSNEDMFEEAQGDDLSSVPAVQIYTVHQAKGLEWPVVFLPALINRRFPSSMANRKKPEKNFLTPENLDKDLYDINRYKTKMVDEARLFYVAMTRAKNVLVLSNFRHRANGNNVKESIFLNMIKERGDNIISELNPEDSLSEHKDFPPDKEFEQNFSQEFMELAITEILNYEKCPAFYRFQQVWGFSPKLNRYLGYGFSLHHVLRELVELSKNGLDLSDKKAVDKALDTVIGEKFHMPYLSEALIEIMRGSVKKTLKKYLDKNGKTLNNMLSVETRIEFVESNAILTGKADIIVDKNDGAKGKDIQVRDYKTMEISKYKELLPFYKLQLQLYGAALTDMGYSPNEGFIDFLKDPSPKFADPYSVDMGPEDIKRAREKAGDNLLKIRNLDYKVPKSVGKCKGCYYEELCSEKKKIQSSKK